MPGVCYTPDQKLEIARALADIGVHVMSVGFPAASKGDCRTLQLVMDAKRRGQLGDVEIVVMCRSNRNDIDVTVRTLREVGVEPRDVTFFIFTSGSDLHLKYKIGKTLLRYEGRDEREWLDLPLSFYRAANIRLQCDAIRHARECGVERVEFGAEDGSRGDVEYFIEYFKAGLDAGGTRPAWPDTVGTLTPEATRWYCSRIVAALPEGLADRRPPPQRLRPGYDQCDRRRLVRLQGDLGYGQRLRRAGRQRQAPRVRRGTARAVRHRAARLQVRQSCAISRASWSA